jgi:hypothetical protein
MMSFIILNNMWFWKSYECVTTINFTWKGQKHQRYKLNLESTSDEILHLILETIECKPTQFLQLSLWFISYFQLDTKACVLSTKVVFLLIKCACKFAHENQITWTTRTTIFCLFDQKSSYHFQKASYGILQIFV